MKGLLLLVLLAQGELPVTNLRPPAVKPVESADLAAAAAPVTQWAGVRVAMYEAEDAWDQPAPGEALFESGAILISRAQFAAFRSSQELAEFLSHAVAHVRLGHPGRVQEKLETVRAMRMATTHADHVIQKLLEELDAERAEMEREATTLAPEILATADCAPGPCALFGRLLAAARR